MIFAVLPCETAASLARAAAMRPWEAGRESNI